MFFMGASEAAARLHLMARKPHPCHRKDGVLKERWATEEAAWYVVELCSLGLHGRDRTPKKLYVYQCPHRLTCGGYHLSTVRTQLQLETHDAGLADLRNRRKMSLGARKK